MQFLTTFVLFIGLSSTFAAPASPQEDLQAELKNALEPVKADVRSMLDNAQVAASDLTKALSESGSNILVAGKSLVAPVDSMDRANLGEEYIQRAKNFQEEVKVNAKSLMDRINQDVQPLSANERSALFNMGDAVRMIQSKYLTDDGQELVKMVSRVLMPGQ